MQWMQAERSTKNQEHVPIFRLLVVRSDGAVHPLGERPRPDRFRVVEPGAFRVSLRQSCGSMEALTLIGIESLSFDTRNDG